MFNVLFDENITGSLGPIMVSPEYVGNGYQSKMMKGLENYCIDKYWRLLKCKL
ncbi:MAG: GNAT family N-acetyltransferase [Bacilli bacterium]|nr:GNAT family N-acetyltransferase [Bacilli bacterium]